MKFRKKPVVIEAVPIGMLMDSASGAWRELPSFVSDAYDRGDLLFVYDGIDIKTLEGWMHGGPADMLIRGVQGELYPCKPEIFYATYEQVEEPRGIER